MFTREILPEQQREAAIPSIYVEKAGALAIEEDARHIVQLLESGDDALLVRLHLIRAAQTSIKIQTFIWKQDGVTRVLFDELMQAADRGVEVRLLVDAFYSLGTAGEQARLARAHEGLEIRLFNPFSPDASPKALGRLRSFFVHGRRMNRRMHHKVMLVDDRIAIVGGRNYQQTYFDRDPNYIFRDRELLAIGPEIKLVQETFDKFWTHRRAVELGQFHDVRRMLRRGRYSAVPPPSDVDRFLFRDIDASASSFDPVAKRESLGLREVERLEFLTDTPSRFRRLGPHNMTRRTRELVRNARKRVVFQTPYLIYNRQKRKDLAAARKHNPDLRVKVSTNSLAAYDHVHVYALFFKHREALFRRMHIEIHKFKPFPEERETMAPRLRMILAENGVESSRKTSSIGPRMGLHAKSLVVDSRKLLIGTHIFDPRSSNINSECGFLIKDAKFVREVEESILRDLHPRNSWVVGKRLPNYRLLNWVNRPIGTLFMHLPIMDIWPHTFTSVFDLKIGGEVTSPFAPEFYEHYRDVGLFPEATCYWHQTKMRFVRAFGGWTRRWM